MTRLADLVKWWDRLPRPIKFAAELAVAGALSLLLGWAADHFRRNANRQAQAEERVANADERIATALERAYPAAAEVPDEVTLQGNLANALNAFANDSSPITKRRGHLVRPVSRNFVRPALCPEQTEPEAALPDALCANEAIARRCWNGVGESMWITPPECLSWYERNGAHDKDGLAVNATPSTP